MIRIVNFFCFALSAFACLALYHVSEQTRVARAELKLMRKEIVQERQLADSLQAEWGRATDPGQIARVSQTSSDDEAPAVELASVALLPRRGDNQVADAELRSASAVIPAAPSSARPGN
jgi:hypothetical protein